MSGGELRVGDRLVGDGNWSPWKARIVLILEEGELWYIVENLVVPLTDAVILAEFRKRNIKAKRSIQDAVKNHIIHHVSSKYLAFQMWQSLCSIYQSPNQNQNMVLQKKLRDTKSTKIDSVTSYLTIFSQILDDLEFVGEVVDPCKLVRTTLNGLSKPSKIFVQGIVAREHMPN
jgi:hypothetical protein